MDRHVVDLDGNRMWCPRHLVFLVPYGMDVFCQCSLRLASTTVEQLVKLGVPGAELEEAIQDAMPLCCHVGDDMMREVYAAYVPMN